MPPGQSATHSLGPLLCQEIQRQLVGLAGEVLEQGVVEDGVVGGSSQKQGHAGPEFQVVGVGEDLFSARPFTSSTSCVHVLSLEPKRECCR